jgi:predicted nucleotidyltransferase
MTIKTKVAQALKGAGLTLEELSSNADQVILFGSCAAGCDTPRSDVDLLCVGKGERKNTGRLHLLWIEASSLNDPRWLGSEIGGHVSKYGIWLGGKRTLGPPQPPSLRTLQKKRQRILERAAILVQKWPLLSEAFKAKQLRNLRLDLQRFQMLSAGEPVDPNPMLGRTKRNG